MKALLKKIATKARRFLVAEHKQKLETLLLLQGKQLSSEHTKLIQSLRLNNGLINNGLINGGGDKHLSIESTEFKIFSQNGEDGIIDFLIQALDLSAYPKAFIEFGVENYTESNTRFLLQHRNFMGLVLDGSQQHIDYIRNDDLYWRYDLEAKCVFITKDNINALISTYLQSRDLENVALLSIDIDGNDYYIWESITCIQPAIVLIEYNALFGAKDRVSVPYRADFNRFKAHFSGLYFGASIAALIALGEAKGYSFVGADSCGVNLFFVKKALCADWLWFLDTYKDLEEYCTRHKARQSRDDSKKLTFLSHTKRQEAIAHLPLTKL